MRTMFNDMLLSILCGLALLAAVRAANAWLLVHVPDEWLWTRNWTWPSPLDRLAAARLLLFLPLAATFAALLAWPLARHASRRDIVIALPGAACGAVLFFLLSQAFGHHPFPLWLDVSRAAFLLLALPAATWLWWQRLPR